MKKFIDKSKLFFIREQDLNAYLNKYDPLVKTQLGFNFMKYPQLQLSAILISQSLLLYFSSNIGSTILIQLYALFFLRCIVLFIINKALTISGLDEINKEIDDLIIRNKGYVFLFIIFMLSLFFYSLNYSLENEPLYIFLGMCILGTVAQLIAHVYREYEYKTKDFEKGDKPSYLIGLAELKKIRDHHLKTDARLINLYSEFVNMMILIFLLCSLYDKILPENTFLPDLLANHDVLFFQTKEFWWVLLPNFPIRYSLFSIIECIGNPTFFKHSKLWASMAKFKTSSIIVVGLFGPVITTTMDNYAEMQHNATYADGDMAKVNKSLWAKSAIQWLQKKSGLIPYDSSEGQEVSHCIRSCGKNDSPCVSLRETGDINPQETVSKFNKMGFAFERDPDTNRLKMVEIEEVSNFSILAPNTWLLPPKKG